MAAFCKHMVNLPGHCLQCKKEALIHAAKTWYMANPDSNPIFSFNADMPAFFNDNNDADDIEVAIILAGQEAGYKTISL